MAQVYLPAYRLDSLFLSCNALMSAENTYAPFPFLIGNALLGG